MIFSVGRIQNTLFTTLIWVLLSYPLKYILPKNHGGMFKILRTLLVLLLTSGVVFSQEINWLTKDNLAEADNSKGYVFLIETEGDLFAKRIIEELNQEPKIVDYFNTNVHPVRLNVSDSFTLLGENYSNAMKFAGMFGTEIKPISPTMIFVQNPTSESDVLQGYAPIKEYLDAYYFKPLIDNRERQADLQKEKIAQQKVEWEAEKRKARSAMNNYRVYRQDEADRPYFNMVSSQGFTMVGTAILDFETTDRALIANADYYKAAEYMFIIIGINDAAGSPRLDLWNPDSEFHYAKINGKMRSLDNKRSITLYSYSPSSNHKAETYVLGNHRGQYKVYMSMKIRD